jgi:predicted  nucleic acid-binding Zn-ribbon protein
MRAAQKTLQQQQLAQLQHSFNLVARGASSMREELLNARERIGHMTTRCEALEEELIFTKAQIKVLEDAFKALHSDRKTC